MADITLSSAVRSNLLNLQSTADLLGKTQERLATGLKVNSALDNPTNFFTASALESRASDLGRLLDSISNANQTLEAADNGLGAITKLVESAQATARQALQTAATIEETTTTVDAEATTGTGTVDLSNDTAATHTGDASGLANDTAAVATGSAATRTNTVDSIFAEDATFSVTVNGNTLTFEIYDSSAAGTADQGADIALDLDLDAADLDDFQAAFDTALSGATAQGVDAAFANFSATFNGSDELVITTTDTNQDFTTAGLTGFGIADADYEATSTAIQALATAGATLDITSGANTDTLDFTGLTSVADLDAAVAALSVAGLTISSTDGDITITADDAATSFTIADGATTGAAAGLGLTEGDYDPSSTVVGALTGTLSITVGSNAAFEVDFDTAGLTSQEDLEAALAGLTGASATIDGSGNLTITADADSEDSITIAGGTGVGLTDDTYDATTSDTTADVANPKRDEYVTQYNDLLGQIDALVGDAGFNGVNLLNGDTLSVLFNEDGSSKLDITGVTFDSAGLGLSEVADGGFDEDDDINTTLDTLGDAVDDLRAQASNFGSNLSVVEIRQNFTKNMINTLETGAGNLTLADTNEEAANLLALQTRQQLSSTALSLASQADQNVLRLF